jgi:DNA-binding SARP family transcriptional activator
VALYRGELYADLADADWITLDREHYRARFVHTATRAAHICVGRGTTDQAEDLAQRALDVDPWAEQAHAVLIAAALAHHHRSAAYRRLQICLRAFDEIGVEPSPTTRQLQRRIGIDPP